MLFVATLKVTGGTQAERTARRLEWDYPENTKPIAEYWLMGNDISVVAVFETNDVASIMATLAAWDDVFDISVTPAVSAQQGMQLAQQMFQ
jgi:hypothetical protein